MPETSRAKPKLRWWSLFSYPRGFSFSAAQSCICNPTTPCESVKVWPRPNFCWEVESFNAVAAIRVPINILRSKTPN